MKIIFTYYPLKVAYSHACALLAGICRDAGIEAFIVPISDTWEEKLNIIQPDFIGFSFVTVHEYRLSLGAIKKAKDTGATLLAGGVFLKTGGEIIDGLFDFVCRGEAESLPNFLLAGDTSVFTENQTTQDIDTLPDYSCVTGYEFDRGIPFFAGKKIIPYSTSRGCPHNCSFCLAKKQDKSVRIKSTIKKDMKYLYELFTPDLFYITDELPPYYDYKWKQEFFNNKYPFTCYIRCDIKADELQFLIDNGMKACVFGVESGDEAHRNQILKKGITDEQIYTTVETLRRNGIYYVPFYMHGSPGETEETRAKTAYMRELVGGFPITWQYEDLFSVRKSTMPCTVDSIPEVFHILHELGGPYQQTRELLTTPNVFILMPNPGSVFISIPINDTTCSGHVYVMPQYRGKMACDAEKECIEWVLNNTQFKNIVGFTETKQAHIIDFHLRAGMKKVCEVNDQTIFTWEKR